MTKREDVKMKKTIVAIFVIGMSTTMLQACSNAQLGTALGGAAGAGVGYAVTGDPLGAAFGGGAGALLGYSIGAEQDRRDYYRSIYYRR